MMCYLSKHLKDLREQTLRIFGGREFQADQTTREKGPEQRTYLECPRNTSVPYRCSLKMGLGPNKPVV